MADASPRMFALERKKTSKHSKAYCTTEGRLEHKQARMENIINGLWFTVKSYLCSINLAYDFCKSSAKMCKSLFLCTFIRSTAETCNKTKRMCALNAKSTQAFHIFLNPGRSILKITADRRCSDQEIKKLDDWTVTLFVPQSIKKSSNSS